MFVGIVDAVVTLFFCDGGNGGGYDHDITFFLILVLLHLLFLPHLLKLLLHLSFYVVFAEVIVPGHNCLRVLVNLCWKPVCIKCRMGALW